ncbi:hypothetical protein GCM10010387_08960 [Streptomyces inusitatus]|uniref:Uncharacterized protein n=1 Tax=Streptomyces inusitatus TaxID=68221 RepID=A0A918PS64_9ACTN|nr:hypothetical protein [Streptomyces inusitatus]GGZ18612.1 hypothetical protein GCM10010387_08960 [Streptomyces inusitatus]
MSGTSVPPNKQTAPDLKAAHGGRLTVGDIAYDSERKALGVLMAEYGTLYFLRPLTGGREWDVAKEKVHPATTTEQLSPAVAEANANSLRRADRHRP